MKEKAKEFIREAINSVPKERSWGIIIKIDQLPKGRLEYEYLGSYWEPDEENGSKKHEVNVEITFEDIKDGIKMLQEEDQEFAENFTVDYSIHREYKTESIILGKKF